MKFLSLVHLGTRHFERPFTGVDIADFIRSRYNVNSSSDHINNLLSTFRKEGRIVRISFGRYATPEIAKRFPPYQPKPQPKRRIKKRKLVPGKLRPLSRDEFFG